MSEIVIETVEEIEAAHPMVDVSPELEAITDHAEEVMQGTLDTLEGNESYGLTDAQRYLNAVLYAAGEVPVSVTGNEGVLSTIKGWAVKAIEAIKRAFKAVWDYLFGKTNPEEQVKELQNTIKTHVLHLTEFKQKVKKTSGSSTSSNVVIQLANNYAKAAEEVRAEDPALAKQYEVAAEQLKEKPEITSNSDSRIVRDEKLFKKMQAIAFAADKYNETKAADYNRVYAEVKNEKLFDNLGAFAHNTFSLKRLVDEATSIDGAAKALADMDSHIHSWGIGHTMGILKSNKSRTEDRIKRLESKASGHDDEGQMRKDIEGLKKVANLMKGWIANMEAQLNACKRLAKMMPKLYRLPA